MRIDVLTLFPDLVDLPLSDSIIGRARQSGLLDLNIHDIRIWTDDLHRTADDAPYGGGAGMVMKAEPIVRGADWISEQTGTPDRIVILAATGRLFSQQLASELAQTDHLLLICGHYEGIDDRVRVTLGADEISIGDYVLTGGELAAAVVIDAVGRLLPGAIKPESIHDESHSKETGGLLEYPQYTRPATFRGLSVPEILLSGNHARIRKWRRLQSIRRTILARPELMRDGSLTAEEQSWIDGSSDRPSTNETP